jgi:murein DD-endopeptidase MepM/ murein hydrolase activator NlpD
VVSTPTPQTKKTPSPTPSLIPVDEGELPPELQETFEVPVIARTRARNTAKLVEALTPLTEYGLSLEQALVEGMGRFPVAGLAYYSDDWFNPRFTPEFHLHHGLDIFADFGSPIRSPDKGVVLRLSDSGAGGIGAWVRGSDGTQYYFAHMQERIEGIHVGMKVKIGTVIGFVGNTGNADGGAPHLHFEVHPSGGPAVPPKPTVDRWLDAAEGVATKWVDLREKDLRARQKLLEAGAAVDGSQASDLDATMLLTLLDPVGGSVGILPRLELPHAKPAPVSAHLMNELIYLRLHGFALVPGAQSGHFAN